MNPRIAPWVFTVLAFAAVLSAIGAFVAPSEVWPSMLIAGVYLSGMGLAGAFIIAMHDASGGRWLQPLRPIAQSLTRLVLPGSAIALLAITVGGFYLYPSFHEPVHGAFKSWWLARPFFTVRAVVYATAWVASLRLLSRPRLAPAFLVIFGITVPLASFDWIMALQPEWASTIFGVYNFAGLVVGGLAVVAFTITASRRNSVAVEEHHLHDIGKLLFAFSTFWMYIWFSQAMLIWYANIPEETSWYGRRAFGNWGILFWAVVVLEWIIPFLVLLPESAKTNRTVMMRVAAIAMMGRWLDLYVAIVPAHAHEPYLSGWHLAIAFGAFAAVGWVASGARLERARELAPVVD